jgi:predicted amidohydrolase
MIRIGSYQVTPESTFAARKAQVNRILEKADKEHVEFVCLPEGFLTGYYAEEELARENCLEVASTIFQEWLAEVSHYRSTIIIGFNERDEDHLFDSVAVVEKGNLLGIQRKHYLYHNYFTPGSSFSIFCSKGVLFGVIICLDTNYFEPARLLALQGATILFSPMCNRVSLSHPYAKRPSYYSHFVARSFENRCWLVTADWTCPNDGSTVCPGHSVIYDPDGQEIARSAEGEEALLIVDIPKDRLFQEKGRRVHGSPILLQEISKLAMRESTLCGAVYK